MPLSQSCPSRYHSGARAYSTHNNHALAEPNPCHYPAHLWSLLRSGRLSRPGGPGHAPLPPAPPFSPAAESVSAARMTVLYSQLGVVTISMPGCRPPRRDGPRRLQGRGDRDVQVAECRWQHAGGQMHETWQGQSQIFTLKDNRVLGGGGHDQHA